MTTLLSTFCVQFHCIRNSFNNYTFRLCRGGYLSDGSWATEFERTWNWRTNMFRDEFCAPHMFRFVSSLGARMTTTICVCAMCIAQELLENERKHVARKLRRISIKINRQQIYCLCRYYQTNGETKRKEKENAPNWRYPFLSRWHFINLNIPKLIWHKRDGRPKTEDSNPYPAIRSI